MHKTIYKGLRRWRNDKLNNAAFCKFWNSAYSDADKLHCPREVDQTIFYEGIEVGTRRADFVIASKLIVEIKAVINLEDVHLAQVKNYLVAYNFEKGLLINFGSKSLQYKLIFNQTLVPYKK
jgi:GxxExxY protein